MVTRRSFVQLASAACASAALPSFPTAQGLEMDDPIRWVNPHIGTGGHGHCFPGATVPFGAVQLSPDTYNDEWDWCSGYHYSDSSIMGFSHTHLSGTGCGDLLDFLVMAGVGPVKLQPGSRANPTEGYRSRFSHEQEVTEPGYYSVYLADPKVTAELTATERTGLHRYTFPASEEAWLIVDLSHSYLRSGGSSVFSSEFMHTSPDTLAGGHVTCAWTWKRRCYFTLQVSKQPLRIDFYSDDKLVSPEAMVAGRLDGDNLKAVLHFHTDPHESILVRTGISGVSAEGAARNLRAEQPTWDFAKTRAAAQAKWREQLSRVQVRISDPEKKHIFYTALYHMSLGPTLYDDVDGQYYGMDHRVYQLPPGQRNYTCFSLWDTFRAAHPAYTIFQSDRLPDFMNTLIRMGQQSLEGIPVWPLQGIETGGMTGYHSAAVISEAVNKGIQGIDVEGAYQLMMRRAMDENFRGMGYYRQIGYLPADRESESVSECLEYCYDDWAVAQVAKHLGHDQVAAMLVKRSKNYRNHFNAATQFMEPRMMDGTWAKPFDPIELGHSSRWHDYTESNAWQTSFGVQHDPAGLIELYGGNEGFVRRLDMLFSVSSAQPPDAPLDIAGLVGQYAHGNEPSHHIAYLYVYGGTPYKTQARVRMLMDTMYHAAPDGIAGNEDVGQMSAWFVLSALGFYAVDPVGGIYVLGSPLVEDATVKVANGNRLVLQVKRSNPEHKYIQTFMLNGVPQQRAWFHHSEIASGAHILLEMGPEPNLQLGVASDHLPPSLQL